MTQKPGLPTCFFDPLDPNLAEHRSALAKLVVYLRREIEELNDPMALSLCDALRERIERGVDKQLQ